MLSNKQIMEVILLVAATFSFASLTSAQFLPQSHLGRLVQSIASPLVLSSGAYSEASDSSVNGDPSARYNPYEQAGVEPQARQPQRPHRNQHASGLEQAPSQQRGVPQHYYYGGSGANQEQDSDQGSAQPSNSKHTQQDYQMGAYLGPTMDDKELNGVFNSNNDDRDDDESSGYDGPAGASGQQRPSGDSYAHGPQSNSENSGSSYERQPSYHSHQSQPSAASAYDDDGADEDEPVAAQRRPSYRGGGLSQAASQYRQQGSAGGPQHSRRLNNNNNHNNNNQQLMAAANGYAPYGYSTGPVDLTGLMAGMSGAGDPNSNYQVYNGDGSYPGANNYPQGAQRGGRNQAASMNNGYYNQQGGYGPNGYSNQAGRSGGDNDDNDNDADED